MLLESVSLDGYSVHVSSSPYDPDEDDPKVTELSLSNSDPNALKIMKFNKSTRARAAETLHTNVDFFRFFHPESESFVNASCDPFKDKKPRPNKKLNDFMAGSGSTVKASSRRSTMAKLAGKLTGKSGSSAMEAIDESEMSTPSKDLYAR